MAKITKPNKKGVPPTSKDSSKNLDKIASNELVDLNFKVSPEFKKEFQIYSLQNDFKTYVSFLKTCFQYYKDNN
jgi:hypothetical protein